MDDTITTIYCLCDEFLKAIGHRDDLQVRMSTAEVMTVPLVAATFFGANIDKTRLFLHEYGYVKKMLAKSRLNRRIHAIEPKSSGGYCLSCWLKPSRSATPIRRTWWTPCRWQPATIFASAAVGSILPKKAPERSEATSRASDATSTDCGCIW